MLIINDCMYVKFNNSYLRSVHRSNCFQCNALCIVGIFLRPTMAGFPTIRLISCTQKFTTFQNGYIRSYQALSPNSKLKCYLVMLRFQNSRYFKFCCSKLKSEFFYHYLSLQTLRNFLPVFFVELLIPSLSQIYVVRRGEGLIRSVHCKDGLLFTTYPVINLAFLYSKNGVMCKEALSLSLRNQLRDACFTSQ